MRAPLHDVLQLPPPQPEVELELPASDERNELSKALDVSLERQATFSAAGSRMHQGENRRRRRAEVAKFKPTGEVAKAEPKLRRKLLKQRQLKARGTMDPELNRLRRRKAKTK